MVMLEGIGNMKRKKFHFSRLNCSWWKESYYLHQVRQIVDRDGAYSQGVIFLNKPLLKWVA